MTKSLASFALVLLAPALLIGQVTALRIGHLVDPETGSAAANQLILVEAGKFTAIGGNVSIPAGAEVVDLSRISQRRYSRRDRQGRSPEHSVWRESDQDLCRLQALWVYGGRNEAVCLRGGQGGLKGRRARADACGRDAGDRSRHLVHRTF